MKDDREYLLGRTKSVVTFTTKRRLMHVASDVLNNMGDSDAALAEATGLSLQTVKRMRTLAAAKSGAEYRPNAATLEKILEAAGACVEVLKR